MAAPFGASPFAALATNPMSRHITALPYVLFALPHPGPAIIVVTGGVSSPMDHALPPLLPYYAPPQVVQPLMAVTSPISSAMPPVLASSGNTVVGNDVAARTRAPGSRDLVAEWAEERMLADLQYWADVVAIREPERSAELRSFHDQWKTLTPPEKAVAQESLESTKKQWFALSQAV
ncbi:hypothetical protein AURDEDRAFT_131936 [Auricularia subglabra TFB-10046 SS5]|uniref:Uncharacterized protein n=1 Tax=Auricularia subglabra (strain TFB-10046 / SS5) TaxID=717982 RepID=J0WMB3_AURST|nr:hypothetical protein AURDEDRAFT_131936 [Auricularia subglabra TFB-10046 SS5]